MRGATHKTVTVAPEVHVTTALDAGCPNCVELVVYQYEAGRPVTTKLLVRSVEETEAQWWQRVLTYAQALQHMYPVYRSRSVVVITGVYDDAADARMLVEREMWKIVRFDADHGLRKEALMVLADLYASQATRAVH